MSAIETAAAAATTVADAEVHQLCDRRAELLILIDRDNRLGQRVAAEFERRGTKGCGVLVVNIANLPQEVEHSLAQAFGRPQFRPYNVEIYQPEALKLHPNLVPITEAICKAFQRFVVNIKTWTRNARRQLFNAIRNAEFYPESISFAAMHRYAAPSRTPALVLGAGPSLDKTLATIPKDIARRAVLIACDTALPALLERGIRPHFVASVDIGPRKAEIFRRIDPADTILLATTACNPAFAKAWRATRGELAWVEWDNPAREFLPSLRNAAGAASEDFGISEPLSCLNLAYHAAVHFGCNPIVLAGCDLALGTGDSATQTHASGTFGHWGELGQPRMDERHEVQGLDDARYGSVPMFGAIRSALEQQIGEAAVAGVETLNATAAGALIFGAMRCCSDLRKAFGVDDPLALAAPGNSEHVPRRVLGAVADPRWIVASLMRAMQAIPPQMVEMASFRAIREGIPKAEAEAAARRWCRDVLDLSIRRVQRSEPFRICEAAKVLVTLEQRHHAD